MPIISIKEFMTFEYMPEWIKTGIKIQIHFRDTWYTGTVIGTPLENERGIDIHTDQEIPDGRGDRHTIGIPVYMTDTEPKDWSFIIPLQNS